MLYWFGNYPSVVKHWHAAMPQNYSSTQGEDCVILVWGFTGSSMWSTEKLYETDAIRGNLYRQWDNRIPWARKIACRGFEQNIVG